MKVGYSSEPDGMATFKYEIIPFDPERQVIVQSVNRLDGLMIMDIDKVKDIHGEGEEDE